MASMCGFAFHLAQIPNVFRSEAQRLAFVSLMANRSSVAPALKTGTCELMPGCVESQDAAKAGEIVGRAILTIVRRRRPIHV